MGWVDLSTEQDLVMNSLESAEDCDPNKKLLQVEVSIPETIEEEREEESLSTSPEQLNLNSQEVIHERADETKDSNTQNKPLREQILRKLSSHDGYSGLEETTDVENQSSPATAPRRSRLSRLLGLEFVNKESPTSPSASLPHSGNHRSNKSSRVKHSSFFSSDQISTSDSNKSVLDDSETTMAEKFPGFKYRSQSSHLLTNETNLSLVEEEMDDIPPQQLTPKGRYTTLKQILGTDERGGYTSAPADTSFKDVKGIKGTRMEFIVMGDGATSASAGATSARARERTPAGLGAVFGGVLFERLVVRKTEFTPRLLEMKLHEILPISFANTSASPKTSTPLNTNKITTFREFGVGTHTSTPHHPQLSYDGHLALDGVDFSRDKHVEVLLRILDLPIDKSIEMIQSWVTLSINQSTATATDTFLTDRWEEFVTSNTTLFNQKVREAKMLRLEEKRVSPSLGQDSLVTTFPSSPGVPQNSNRLQRQYSAESASSSGGKGMDSMMRIQHLDVRYCQLTNRGVTLLVDSLRKNLSLASLNLSGNSISRDNTAASLGNMLNFNVSLVELNLQETSLGNTGATLVAQALHINRVRISSLLGYLPHVLSPSLSVSLSVSLSLSQSLSVSLCLSLSLSLSHTHTHTHTHTHSLCRH
jgi:hypothetical protein